jgi:hypothetical protein
MELALSEKVGQQGLKPGCGKAPSLSLALATEDGWPISRWFFARCGIPPLFPSSSRFVRCT